MEPCPRETAEVRASVAEMAPDAPIIGISDEGSISTCPATAATPPSR